ISRNSFFEKSTLVPYLNSIRIIRGLAGRIIATEKMARIRTWFSQQVRSKPNVIALNWLSEKVRSL
ncbi:MAG: hypothetical protein DWQ02_11670, partial [Bacteroidetes bacterium]